MNILYGFKPRHIYTDACILNDFKLEYELNNLFLTSDMCTIA